MRDLAEYVDDLLNLCGSEQLIEAAIRADRDQPVFLGQTPVDIADIDSAFAVALHMHQPLIPAAGPDLRQAVEWLGCPWGHAVAPSTPTQDYRLHVRAWQHHFAAIFGLEALGRLPVAAGPGAHRRAFRRTASGARPPAPPARLHQLPWRHG